VREASDLSSRLLVVLDVLLRRIAWLGGYELWLVVYRCAQQHAVYTYGKGCLELDCDLWIKLQAGSPTIVQGTAGALVS
jgi:hypothetical protein